MDKNQKIQSERTKLLAQADEKNKALLKIAEDNDPLRVKAQKITCRKCGSALAKEYLRRYGIICPCPVCKASLFSPTAQERMQKTQDTIQKIRTKLDSMAEEQKETFEEALTRVRDQFDVIFEEVKDPDFIEIHGKTGGDMRSLRVYKNGNVYER